MILQSIRKPSFSFVLSLVIILVALTLTSINSTIVYQESHKATLDSAELLFSEIAGKVKKTIDSSLDSISIMTYMGSLAIKRGLDAVTEEDLYQNAPLIKGIIESNENLMSAYVGYASGDFYQLIATRGSNWILDTYQAPAGTQYIDRAITREKGASSRQHWRFFDVNMKLISDRVEHQFQYDPTTRPWYLNALKTNRSVFSKPYIFSSSKLPGITCACALGDRSAVFGMDITLSQLDHMLATQKVAQHGTLLIMDRDRRVVAGSGSSRATAIFGQLELPLAFEAADTLVRRVAEKMDSGGQAFPERPFILDVERGRHLVSLTPISQHGIDLIIAVAAPLDELTHYIGQMGLRCLAISLVVLLIAMSLGILAAKRISGSFGQLILEAQRIQRFDFSEHPPIRSRIKEIHSLIASCEVMKSTIQKTMEALVDIQAKQRKLVEAGLALSAEKD